MNGLNLCYGACKYSKYWGGSNIDAQTTSWVFSGVGVTAIVSLFAICRLIFVMIPFPLFKIIDEEKVLLNNSILLLRRIIFEIGAFFVISLLALTIGDIAIAEVKSNKAFTNLSTFPLWVLFTFGFIFLLILCTFLLLRFKPKFREAVFELLTNNRYSDVTNFIIFFLAFLVTIYTYIFITVYCFGYIVNYLLVILGITYKIEFKTSFDVLLKFGSTIPAFIVIVFSIIYLLLYLTNRWLLLQIYHVSKLISYNKVFATITLTNGEIITDKFILRPSIDGSILIGDKSTLESSLEKIMLPKKNILYIEFKRITYLFGKEMNRNAPSVNKDNSNVVYAHFGKPKG